ATNCPPRTATQRHSERCWRSGPGGHRAVGVGAPVGPGAGVEGGRRVRGGDAGGFEGEDDRGGGDAGAAVGADRLSLGDAEGGEPFGQGGGWLPAAVDAGVLGERGVAGAGNVAGPRVYR